MNAEQVRYFGFPAISNVLLLAMVLGAMLIVPNPATAQLAAGAINGIVLDPAGAVVPDAKIVLRNVDTGTERQTKTNNVGEYVLVEVPPGRYTLAAIKEGFREARIESILVSVDQTATYNITLQVSATSQSVTVHAPVATVETSTTELGATVESHAVIDLPLNTRNFTEMLILSPGVSTTNVTQSSTGWLENPIGPFVVPSVNGQNNENNLWLLDGLNNSNNYASMYAWPPVIDDIEEFKVQSHNDEAQYGGVTGGIINVVTKSGTNKLHGDAWEFLRNNSFDARSPFLASVTPFKQNQFGATVGGPVVLPHYNGRNKTFFFGTYEGYRYSQTAETLYRVPTPAELSGDLSDLPEQLYNPFTTQPDPNNPGAFIRQPFPNNQIPASLLNSGMVSYAKTLFPAPIATGIPNINGINSINNTIRQDEYSGRIDEMLNASNTLWFRYSGFTQPTLGAAGFVGLLASNHTDGTNWGASWLHVFSPAATMQLAVGRNATVVIDDSTDWPGRNPASVDATVGFAPHFDCSFSEIPNVKCLIPGMTIPGFLSGNPSYTLTPTMDVWEGKGDFTLVEGRNTFKTGLDINSMGQCSKYGCRETDNFVGDWFDSAQTSNLETAAGGNPLASFLLGVPTQAQLHDLVSSEHGGWVDGFYFQDSIKATRKLTANLGIRWDVTLFPIQGTVAQGSLYVGDIDFNNGTYVLQAQPPSCAATGAAPCIPGGVLPPDVVLTPHKNHAILNNDYANWQPRVGLAYALTPRTAIRAGFGMFYDNWADNIQNLQDWSGTWPEVTSILSGPINATVPNTTAEDPLNFGFGSAELLPSPTPFQQEQWYMDPLHKDAYSEQWNFGVEQQLTPTTVLSANYVGSHSSRLDLGPLTNVAKTPGPGNPTLRQPYPYILPTYYDQSIGKSNYNSFQFSLNKTFSGGLTYLIAYTWSKAIDEECSGWYGIEGCSVQNPYDPAASRSVASFDLPQNFKGSMVYELPFGPGKRFSTGNRLLNNVMGNWQLNAIASLNSGIPFSLSVNGDIANTGAGSGYMRPNLVGNNASQYASHPSPADWLSQTAFAIPQAYTFGNVGRNTLRSDRFKNLDLSLFRDFTFNENKRLQFRAEFFNVTNTPTWGIPDADISDQTFGEITSTTSTARQIQFALKFYF